MGDVVGVYYGVVVGLPHVLLIVYHMELWVSCSYIWLINFSYFLYGVTFELHGGRGSPPARLSPVELS